MSICTHTSISITIVTFTVFQLVIPPFWMNLQFSDRWKKSPADYS